MTGEQPVVGNFYRDAEGRELYVAEVALGDRLGREVRGFLLGFGAIKGTTPPSSSRTDYATDLKTWAAIWRDQTPRRDPRKLRIG